GLLPAGVQVLEREAGVVLVGGEGDPEPVGLDVLGPRRGVLALVGEPLALGQELHGGGLPRVGRGGRAAGGRAGGGSGRAGRLEGGVVLRAVVRGGRGRLRGVRRDRHLDAG